METNLLRQTLSVLASRWLIKLLNFCSFFIIVRVLSSDDFGLYGIFISAVFLIGSIGNLGIRQASAYIVGKQEYPPEEVFGSSITLLPLFTILSGFAIWILSTKTAPQMGAPWFLPSLVSSGGVILSSFSQGIFLGQGDIQKYNIVEVIPRLVMLVIVGGLFLFNLLTIQAVIWAFAIGFSIAGVIGASLVAPYYELVFKKIALIPILLKRGLPYATTLFLIMLNSRISVFLIAGRLDPEASAQYFASLRLTEFVLETAAAIGLVLFSHNSKATDIHKALKETASVTRLMVYLMMALSIIGILIAPFAVPLILGEGYAQSTTILQILLGGLIFSTLSRTIYPTIAGQGRPLLGAVVIGPAVVINFLLSWLLIGHFGAKGAAIALILTQALIVSGLLFIIKRLFNTPPQLFLIPERKEIHDFVSKVSMFSNKVK